MVTLSHVVSGYGAVTDAGTVTIVALDDEAGFDVLYDPASLTIVEGGPEKTYNMKLSKVPGTTVTVTPTNTALTITPATLEFTTENWSEAQAVTVSLADDDTPNSNLIISHTATPASEGYTSPDLAVTVIDNDIETRVRLSLSDGEANEDARDCAVAYPDNADIDPTDPGLLECTAFFLATVGLTPVALPPVLDVIIPENFHEFLIDTRQLPQELFEQPDFDFDGGRVALDLRVGVTDSGKSR